MGTALATVFARPFRYRTDEADGTATGVVRYFPIGAIQHLDFFECEIAFVVWSGHGHDLPAVTVFGPQVLGNSWMAGQFLGNILDKTQEIAWGESSALIS